MYIFSKKETWLAVGWSRDGIPDYFPPLLLIFGRDSNYNFTLRLCFTGLLLRDSMYVRACLTFAETHTCPPRCNRDTFPPNIIHEFWINVLFRTMGLSLIIISKFIRSYKERILPLVNLANYSHFHFRSAILNRWFVSLVLPLARWTSIFLSIAIRGEIVKSFFASKLVRKMSCPLILFVDNFLLKVFEVSSKSWNSW